MFALLVKGLNAVVVIFHSYIIFNNAKYIVFVKFNRKLLKQCKVC